MDNLAGQQIKGYELKERIAAGGFGAVYRAYQSTVGREVAVKIILPGLANKPDFIRRFEAEAQLIARLEHPFIVPLHDYWRDPDGAYLVMRYLRGGSLHDYIHKHGMFSIEDTVNLFSQVAQGLHVAHRNQVIHRDIKPGNILLDEDGNGYLADFGIAKDHTTTQNITEPDSFIGSPEYLAPEQARSETVTPQTDIYSLGVVLYEMLTGTHPFPGLEKIGVIFKHLSEPLPEITTVEDNLCDEINAIIQKATAKDPAHRYKDVIEMAQALRQAAQLDITPTPTSLVELLTPREQEVMQLIIDGKTNREIADILVLAEVTIKQYINNIYRKLKVRSRVQAIARARDLNFVVKKPGKSVDVSTGHLPEPENPYKGLRAFHAADAQDFFGREQLTQKLLSRLQEKGEYHRFLAVVGPSGSGKSSVVKAGLMPALWRGDLPGSENWYIIDFLPGAHPIDELEVALFQIATDKSMNLREQLQRDKRGLIRVADMLLPDDGSELFIVIDQFEEVFTLVEDEQERQHFLKLLQEALTDKRSRVRVVVTLRADYYDKPLQYPDFGELIRSRVETVLPLSAEELERAISEPAHAVGVLFEDGLVSRIVSDVHYQPGALPLLQYALTELFERRSGRKLTLEAYQNIGGTGGALANRADEIYLEVGDEGQELIHQLFLRLVTLGEGAEDTRRRVERSELLAIAPSREQMEEIIDLYAVSRLLSLDNDPSSRQPTVEVAHEAILREWDRLRAWLNESREDIRHERIVAHAADAWKANQKDTSYLLSGTRLEQVEKWNQSTELALTPLEHEFIETSISERAAYHKAETERQAREFRLEQRSRDFLRGLVAVFAIAAFIAIGLSAFAFKQSQIAQTERDNAQNNFIAAERIRLAAQAQIALNNGEGGDIPALLALRSLQLGYSPEADAALLNALTRGFARQRYLGHSNVLENVNFSADGRTVLTSSSDSTARLWDAQTGDELQQFYHPSSWMASLSPDGRYVATAGLDGTARLWNVESSDEVYRFTGHTGAVNWVSFSPDSQYLVSSDNEMVRLWEVQSGQQVRQFIGHTDKIYTVRFSPNGRYLVSGSLDNTARSWDVATGEELQQFVGHSDCPCGNSFSPDGRYLVSGSLDQTARLWDTATGQELKRFIGHTDALYDAQFSPDGRYVLTVSLDKTARLWDIVSGQEVRRFIGHTAAVNEAAFSPDGQYVVTASADRTARLWDIQLETEPHLLSTAFTGHDAYYYTIRLLSDERTVLTGSGDGHLRLWDVQTGEVLEDTLLANLQAFNDMAFSPDATTVLTGGSDGIARLWDTQRGAEIRQFAGHTAPIWGVSFSQDGSRVVTSSEDNTARVWDAQTGAEILQFVGHTGLIWDAVMLLDGRYVLTGSDDHTARLWDVETGQEVYQFVGHDAAVPAIAFSPDGRYVLTGSHDRTARLWDTQTGQEVRQFIGHTDQVRKVAFSPDGRYVLTGSGDQTVRLWDVQTGEEVRRLVGHVLPIQFVGFSSDGEYVLTGDRRIALVWRTQLEAVIAFACAQLSGDLTPDEQALYHITDSEPVCAEFSQTLLAVQPTWTPFVAALAPQATMPPLVTNMEFYSDIGNIQMGLPIQDVYIANDNGSGVIRPIDLSDKILSQPLYTSTERISQDYEAPFEVGPFPDGEPLGFTVADWIAVRGSGTYTVHGSRATLDLSFEQLIPNGVYTLWCIELGLLPGLTVLEEHPCGARDGSENTFIADGDGKGAIQVEIDAFPPSTDEIFYEVAIAYHSDGRTYGPHPGDFGANVHAQAFYDFVASSNP
jgi:WD40 repeat protein/serine/threonine protein kinase